MPTLKEAVVEGASIFKGDPAKAKEPRAPRAPRTPKAAPKGPRKDLSDGLSLVWGMTGSVVARVDGPVGRCMQFQAPYAGKKLNKVIRGSDLLYGFLAPILGGANLLELSSVIMPPLLIAMLERDPRLEPVLFPMLLDSMRPVVLHRAQEAEKQKEQMADLTGNQQEADEELMGVLSIIIGGPPEGFEPGPEPMAPEYRGEPEADGQVDVDAAAAELGLD